MSLLPALRHAEVGLVSADPLRGAVATWAPFEASGIRLRTIGRICQRKLGCGCRFWSPRGQLRWLGGRRGLGRNPNYSTMEKSRNGSDEVDLTRMIAQRIVRGLPQILRQAPSVRLPTLQATAKRMPRLLLRFHGRMPRWLVPAWCSIRLCLLCRREVRV